MATKQHAEVLASGPKCKKAVMFLMEKIQVFDRSFGSLFQFLAFGNFFPSHDVSYHLNVADSEIFIFTYFVLSYGSFIFFDFLLGIMH